MKSLERICIVLITAAALCTFASILFSILEYEELNGVSGHITCVLSVGAIAIAFALMNTQESEKNENIVNTGNYINIAKAADTEPQDTFAEYIVYDDESEPKPINNRN